MRKLTLLICTIFSVILLAQTASAITFNPNFDIYSEAAYLVNLDTGEVVYQKNADKRLVPASLTKIMCAVVLIDAYKGNIGDLSTTYVSGNSQCFDELYMTGCSNADIRIGEKVSYIDLLYALMLRSACEAANIIAYNVGGSLQGFADMMNQKAIEIGCKDTHFTNAHGLFWENHYTTAEDMAKITQYAMSLPLFTEISCTPSYTMEATAYHTEPRQINHTNFMLSKTLGGSQYYYEYAKGIKTGTLDEAGRCLVTLAYKDGYSYMLVTLNAPQVDENGKTVYYNFLDHKNIYEWAFDSLKYTDILVDSEEIDEVKVSYGEDRDYVIVKPAKGYSSIWNRGIPLNSIHRVITLEENVVAPVENGQVMGKLELMYNGKTLFETDLISTSGVERSRQQEVISIAKSFLFSDAFWNAVVYSVILIVVYTTLYIVVRVLISSKRRKKFNKK